MLGNARIVKDVGWWPHYAISVEIRRKPTQIRVHRQLKPRPIPIIADDKGKPKQYECEQDDWQRHVTDALEDAEHVYALDALGPRSVKAMTMQ